MWSFNEKSFGAYSKGKSKVKLQIDPLKEKVGQRRVIKKFLWFPEVWDGQLIWMESVKITQEIRYNILQGSHEWTDINIEFIK